MKRLLAILALALLWAGPSSAQTGGAGAILLDRDIAAPITGYIGPVLKSSGRSADGWRYFAVHAKFLWGSGGTNATAYLQTSLDNGTSWVDIAAIVFTTAAATKVTAVQWQPATPVGVVTPTDGALSGDTLVNGLIGDRIRVKLITTGTYAGATRITVTVTPR